MSVCFTVLGLSPSKVPHSGFVAIIYFCIPNCCDQEILINFDPVTILGSSKWGFAWRDLLSASQSDLGKPETWASRKGLAIDDPLSKCFST